MGKHFSVHISKTCLVCNKELGYRQRSFCSKKCWSYHYNRRPKVKEMHNSYNRKRWGEYAPDKLRCAVCGSWYVQVGTHVRQRHKMTAREYREHYDLPLKRGISPAWYRELKAQITKENGTIENLRLGKKYWYKPNDPKAVRKTGWAGRRGNLGYEPDDYYN